MTYVVNALPRTTFTMTLAHSRFSIEFKESALGLSNNCTRFTVRSESRFDGCHFLYNASRLQRRGSMSPFASSTQSFLARRTAPRQSPAMSNDFSCVHFSSPACHPKHRLAAIGLGQWFHGHHQHRGVEMLHQAYIKEHALWSSSWKPDNAF